MTNPQKTTTAKAPQQQDQAVVYPDQIKMAIGDATTRIINESNKLYALLAQTVAENNALKAELQELKKKK